MKFKILYTFFGLAVIAFMFSSSSQGRANAANSGNTGAPGDNAETCITCHGTNAAIQVDLTIELKDGDGTVLAGAYTPGETYDVAVAINASMGSPAGYGFQMVCLNGGEGEDAMDVPSWSELGDNVQMVKTTSNNRTYVEQDGPSATSVFNMKWTAPAAGAGAVTFYACGNGINGTGSTAGDNAACSTLSFTESGSTSTNDLASELGMSVFPNPATSFAKLSLNNPVANDYQLRIADASGRVVQMQNVQIPAGAFNQELNVASLAPGIYFVQLVDGQRLASHKLIKL